jgi:hypothetical protein
MHPTRERTHAMQVYPCGYLRYGALITHLMEANPHLHLIDTRYSPRSRYALWQEAALRAHYGTRYHAAGKYLGNIHYHDEEPIALADPKTGIAGLVRYLHEGVSLILLCGCADYTACHLRVIVSLLQAALPTVQIILPETLQAPDTVRCLSVRQPWAWLLTHPEVLQSCGIPPKDIENRDWSTAYRGTLYLHAGLRVDEGMFCTDGQLKHGCWYEQFGSAGTRLAKAMPQTIQAYARKAIVGKAELVEVVEEHASPWFVGRYGLVLHAAQTIDPVCNYPGQWRLFDIPRASLESHKENVQ